MKPRTYIEYVLDETYKFNLQSSIVKKNTSQGIVKKKRTKPTKEF
jgi:hypothetical protein